MRAWIVITDPSGGASGRCARRWRPRSSRSRGAHGASRPSGRRAPRARARIAALRSKSSSAAPTREYHLTTSTTASRSSTSSLAVDLGGRPLEFRRDHGGGGSSRGVPDRQRPRPTATSIGRSAAPTWHGGRGGGGGAARLGRDRRRGRPRRDRLGGFVAGRLRARAPRGRPRAARAHPAPAGVVVGTASSRCGSEHGALCPRRGRRSHDLADSAERRSRRSRSRSSSADVGASEARWLVRARA